MIGIYVGAVVASLLLCFWYFMADVRRSIVQNIMLLVILFGNMGYLSLALSKTLEEAILSNKVFYICGCFLPILFFFTVCEVCHVKIRKLIVGFIVILQSIIYAFICTIGFSDIYYKNVGFQIVNGIGTVTKSYGPTHFLYPLTVCFYLGIAIIVAIYTCAKNKNVNRKELMTMMTASASVVVIYIVERILSLEIELLPIAFVILIVSALFPIYHSDIFTVTENDRVISEQFKGAGFITFNKRCEYMGANDTLKELVPELKDARVGYHFKKKTTVLAEIKQSARVYLREVRAKNTEITPIDNLEIGDQTFQVKPYILKNFLGQIVGVTLELRDITEHIKVIEYQTQFNEQLQKEVKQKTGRIREIQEKTILGIAQMVESRDLSTGGHIKRTSKVVKIFSKKLLAADLGYSKEFLKLVIRSAPMHDIGKIGVDDNILRKQGKFTDEEYEIMKSHAPIGGRMVKQILGDVEEEAFVNIAFNVANYHHEKYNGRGYPEGLKGEQIPAEARIMALADVFDALVSKRCYKEAFSYDDAFAIIKKDAGEHFDPVLAELFLECRPQLEEYYNKERE